MKRQSLESCARDFVNNLKKSAMARSSIEVDAEKPVEPTAPASKWDAFVGNPVAEGCIPWFSVLILGSRIVSKEVAEYAIYP